MGHRFPILTAASLAILACSCASQTASAPLASQSAGAAVATRAATASQPADDDGPLVVRLPAVQVATLSGDPTELARLAGGRVALVSLWATWCDSCRREMDALNRLHAKAAQGRDAVVIGVAVGEDRETVAAFVQRRGLRYAQLVDEHFAFADAVAQRRVPATLVVDRDGRIVYRGDALDEKGLEALQRAIDSRP